jgi:hypothetical protein
MSNITDCMVGAIRHGKADAGVVGWSNHPMNIQRVLAIEQEEMTAVFLAPPPIEL